MGNEMDTIQGVVFDFDGVLVDSGPYHDYTWSEAHKRLFERPIPHYTRSEVTGIASRKVAQRIAELSGVPDQGNELYQVRLEVLRTCELVPELAPGARELTGRLTEAGVPYGVVSNAPSAYVRRACETLPFDPVFVLGLEDLGDRPKPDKHPYELGAKQLGFRDGAYSRVLVIEDSPTGARAGVAAGIPVLGLTRGGAASELYDAGVCWVAEDLAEVVAKVFGAGLPASRGGLNGFPGFG